jgi:3-hydroxyacyl-CoA dehydrogenase
MAHEGAVRIERDVAERVDRLGILGAGKLGTAVARLAVDAGRQVSIADERTDPMIELIVSTFAPVELDGRSAWLLETNGPFFGRRLSQAEMNALVSASRRADRLTW